MLDNPFLIIGAVIAVIVVLVTVSMSFKKEKKASKQHQEASKASSTRATSSAPAVPAAESSSAQADKKKPKKKNRSNKTKAQKAKAKEAAAAAAKAGSATQAAAESGENADEDSDDSDDSDDDNVPSAVRFQVVETMPKKQVSTTKAPAAPVKAPAPAPKPEPIPAVVEPTPAPVVEEPISPIHFDGWAVVEDKRKVKAKKAGEEAAPEPAPAVVAPAPVASTPAPEPTPAAPVVETVTSEMSVDSKMVGRLIGPKGATKQSLQDITGTTITFPKDKETSGPVTVFVSGPALGVSKAITALSDLVTKGYASLLEADDFQESYVSVHPKFLPDVIGKGGSAIKALQQHTGVRIVVPNTPKAPLPDGRVAKVKVGLAGKKEKVALARSLIKDLCKYYHTPITHPGITHVEMVMDAKYFNYIIGAKGSEIKNIQNSHKVSVHIPNADSVNPNVVIVGAETNVEAAKRHVEKIIERVDAAAAPAPAVAPTVEVSDEVQEESAAAEGSSVPDPVPPPPGVSAIPQGASWGANRSRLPPVPPAEEQAPIASEPWMKDFSSPPAGGIDLSAMIPTAASFPPPPSLPAPPNLSAGATSAALGEKKAPLPSAWNNLSALPADKW